MHPCAVRVRRTRAPASLTRANDWVIDSPPEPTKPAVVPHLLSGGWQRRAVSACPGALRPALGRLGGRFARRRKSLERLDPGGARLEITRAGRAAAPASPGR